MLTVLLITAASTIVSALDNAVHPLQVRQTTIVPGDCSSSSAGWLSCMSTVISQNDICDQGTDISPCVCSYYVSQSSCWTKNCGTTGAGLTILQSQVAVVCPTTGVAATATTALITTTPTAGHTVSVSGSTPTTTKQATLGAQSTSTATSTATSATTGTKNAAPADRLSGSGLVIALVAIAGSFGLFAYL